MFYSRASATATRSRTGTASTSSSATTPSKPCSAPACSDSLPATSCGPALGACARLDRLRGANPTESRPGWGHPVLRPATSQRHMPAGLKGNRHEQRRRYLITGSSTGFGRNAAERLARHPPPRVRDHAGHQGPQPGALRHAGAARCPRLASLARAGTQRHRQSLGTHNTQIAIFQKRGTWTSSSTTPAWRASA